jgi:cytochrome c oxidase subunit 3
MATSSHPWITATAVPRLRRAVWMAMAAMTMCILALTYAFRERHGLAAGWFTPHLGAILGANTALLLASSLALLRARQFLHARSLRGTLRWLLTALGFGLAFLAGQAVAWWSLFSAGVYIGDHPNSGFFFLVTAAHAVHLAVALGLLGWVASRAWRGRLAPDRAWLMDLTGIIWHCLDVTWVYLFLVLVLYR